MFKSSFYALLPTFLLSPGKGTTGLTAVPPPTVIVLFMLRLVLDQPESLG